MKLAIMQPYFFPYIGYWKLINIVDTFVVYDNIEYTKKGWVNRNRILSNGNEFLFTIPLKKDSDYKYIVEREISLNFDKKKFLCQIENFYSKAPYFEVVLPLIYDIVMFDDNNLFNYLFNSIKKTSDYLGLRLKFVISSHIEIDHNLKSQDKVIAICKALNTKEYYNPIGGIELYSKQKFEEESICLKFIKSKDLSYKQFNDNYIGQLSIIDVMMFNSPQEIRKMLNQYELI